MVKKNFRFGLSALLVLLFIMLLGMFSSCYALTPSSEFNSDDLSGLLEYCEEQNQYARYDYYSTYHDYLTNSTKFNSLLNVFKDAINSLNIPYLEQVSFCISKNKNINLFANNNTIGNDLEHLKIWSDTDGTAIANYFNNIYDNGSVNYNTYYCTINLGNTPTYQKISFSGGSQVHCDFKTGVSNIIDTDNSSVILRLTGNFRQRGTFYYITNNNNYGYLWCDDSNVVNLQNDLPVNPEEPSGDIPSDNGLGNITTSSGDNGGNINLQPIQQGLTNINDSVNTQGENIVNQISGDTQKIVNALTNSNTEQNTESTEAQFEDMISSTANVVDPTINFFSWLIDNIRSVLNSTGDYNITITLFDETYTIRSDFFKLPDGDLKTFLQMSFIAWFGWRIIKKIRYIVYAIQCVNISSALDNADFNADIL